MKLGELLAGYTGYLVVLDFATRWHRRRRDGGATISLVVKM